MSKKSEQRKLSLKKVTVATFANPTLGVPLTEGELSLATVPTGQSVSVSSDLPTCLMKK